MNYRLDTVISNSCNTTGGFSLTFFFFFFFSFFFFFFFFFFSTLTSINSFTTRLIWIYIVCLSNLYRATGLCKGQLSTIALYSNEVLQHDGHQKGRQIPDPKLLPRKLKVLSYLEQGIQRRIQ